MIFRHTFARPLSNSPRGAGLGGGGHESHQLLHAADFFIEVGVDDLRAVEDIVFSLGFSVGVFLRDACFIRQDVIAAEGKEGVDALREFSHGKGVFSLDEVLYIVKVACNGAFQTGDFFLRKVVLGYGDVRFQDAAIGCVFPCFKPHVVFGVVGLAPEVRGSNLCRKLFCLV